MSFPANFIWGAASAAYQIEGGAAEDGKGPSIWDKFSHEPGRIFGDQNGDIAADAYHRFEEDLDLMAGLGIKYYRFSISWPRVFPDGETGQTGEGGRPSGLNPKGLDYYDRVVDACLSRGITPWITLYHWDLPLALQEKGGWLSRDTAAHFAAYAAFIAEHFKGRVNAYITINEPQCAIGMAHVSGLHAPGSVLPPHDQFLSWHNILLAHGLAARAIRKLLPEAMIGIASTGALAYVKDHPESTPEELVRATFRSLPPDKNPGYYFNHQWFLDPVFKGSYPDDPDHPWNAFTESIPADDMEIISFEKNERSVEIIMRLPAGTQTNYNPTLFVEALKNFGKQPFEAEKFVRRAILCEDNTVFR